MKKINRLLAFLLAFTVVITTFSSDLTTAHVYATEEEAVIDSENEIKTVEKEKIEEPVVTEPSTEESTEEAATAADTEEGEENDDAVTGDDKKEVVDPEAVVEEEADEETDEGTEAEYELEFNQDVTVGDVKVTLYAAKEVLPDDAKLDVQIADLSVSEQNKVEEKIEKALNEDTEENETIEVKETINFDINIYAESMKSEDNPDGKVQPKDGTVKVTFENISEAVEDAADADTGLAVFHVADDLSTVSEEAKVDNTTSDEISFDAEHFSTYTVTIYVTGYKQYTYKFYIQSFNPKYEDIARGRDIDISMSASEYYDGKIVSSNAMLQQIGTPNGYRFYNFFTFGVNSDSGRYCLDLIEAFKVQYDRDYGDFDQRVKYVGDSTWYRVNGKTIYAYFIPDVAYTTSNHLDIGFTKADFEKYKNDKSTKIYAVINNDANHKLYAREYGEDKDIGTYEYRIERESSFKASDDIKFYVEYQGKTYRMNCTQQLNNEAFERCLTKHYYYQKDYGFDYISTFTKDFDLVGDVVYHKNAPGATKDEILKTDNLSWSSSSQTQQKDYTIDYTPAAIDGYRFVRWFTKKADGTVDKTYTNPTNIKVTNGQTIDLFAEWVENKITVQYKGKYYTDGVAGEFVDLGTETYNKDAKNEATVPYSKITKVANDKANGFAVDGCYTDSSFSSWKKISKDVKSKENITIYIKYTRTSYGVTYALDRYTAVSPTLPTDSKRYFANNDVQAKKAPVVDGYTFTGWTIKYNNGNHGTVEQEKTFKMPAANVTLVGTYTANSNTVYTVEHYKQNLEDDQYTFAEKDQNTKGTTGSNARYTSKDYTGFTYNKDETEFVTRSYVDGKAVDTPVTTGAKILGNGSLVIKLKYDRNTHSVTYSYNPAVEGASALPTTQLNVKYGATVTVADKENTTAPGYTFNGWTVPETTRTEDGKTVFTMPNNNVNIVGTFTKNDYSVTYRFKANTYVPTGIQLPEVNPSKHEFDSEVATVTYRGDSTGYNFSGWKVAAETEATIKDVSVGEVVSSFKMPAGNVVLEGEFTPATGTAYKLEYRIAKLGGEGYDVYPEEDSDSKTGTTDYVFTEDDLDGFKKNIVGFEFDKDKAIEFVSRKGSTDTPAEHKILPDGSLVIILYYKRCEFQVTYSYDDPENLPEGVDPTLTELASDKYTKMYEYGAKVQVASDAKAPKYTFSGWQTAADIEIVDGSFTMPATDVAFSGGFERSKKNLVLALAKEGYKTDEKEYNGETQTMYVELKGHISLAEGGEDDSVVASLKRAFTGATEAVAKLLSLGVLVVDAAEEVDPDPNSPLTVEFDGETYKIYGINVTPASGKDVGIHYAKANVDAKDIIVKRIENGEEVVVTDEFNISSNIENTSVGELKITQATLTIKADDKTKVEGEEDPKFTSKLSGLVGEDKQYQKEVEELSLPYVHYEREGKREGKEAPGTYKIIPSPPTPEDYGEQERVVPRERDLSALEAASDELERLQGREETFVLTEEQAKELINNGQGLQSGEEIEMPLVFRMRRNYKVVFENGTLTITARGGDDDDDDDDDTTTTITDTPVAAAPAPAVLGAQRAPATGEAPAVLGARRAGTSDTSILGSVITIIVAAAIAFSMVFIKRKKKEEK